MWAYAREGSAKEQMRLCYENAKAENIVWNNTLLPERFSEQVMYAKFVSNIVQEQERVPIKDMPKISLITSVFKAEEHIDQLLEDVTRQSLFEQKCEWIIINVNKSGDDYEEKAILKFKEKYPNNIVYKRLEEDPGIYATWNMAIEMSTGEFITNVNCDDRRPPWAFEMQASALVQNQEIDLVYNDSFIVEDANTMWENLSHTTQRYNFEEFSKEAMLRSNLPHNNPMWRKTLHDNFGMFDDKYRSAGDWEFWLRCAFGGSTFKKLNDILGIYYFNPKGISTNPENFDWKEQEEREVFKKYTNLSSKSEPMVIL